jgi:ketosteroid isomerase-like protein
MSNMADDIVLLAPDSPLIEGKDALRVAYASFISMGRWEFGHDYAGAEVFGDFVMLHGIARGRMTPAEGEPVPVANNFMLTLRRDGSGRFRMWRGAFAPSGE